LWCFLINLIFFRNKAEEEYMAIVGKETIDDVEVNEEGALNPDPAEAIKPATDENGEAKPADGAKPASPGTGEGEKKDENQEDGEKEPETPRPPRTVSTFMH
jgi:hypothetical protein